MLTDTEQEVFEELAEAETADEIFDAVEQLKGSRQTMQGQVLVNAAGYMMGEALLSYNWKNKNE